MLGVLGATLKVVMMFLIIHTAVVFFVKHKDFAFSVWQSNL